MELAEAGRGRGRREARCAKAAWRRPIYPVGVIDIVILVVAEVGG